MLSDTANALRDGLIAPVWLGVNAFAFRFAFICARSLEPAAPVYRTLLHTIVMFLATVIPAAMLLGLLRVLTWWTWMGSVVLVSVILLVLVRRTRRSEVSTCCDANAGAAFGTWMRPSAVWQWIWVLVASIGCGHIVWNGLLEFPSDFDCLMYHLPLIDEWLQARSLYNPDSAYFWTPGNSEVLGLWAVAPFSGDFLHAFSNAPSVVLWVLGTFQSCRLLGLSQSFSHLTSLAVIAIHTTIHQVDDASNDMAVVAFSTVSIYFSLRILLCFHFNDVLACGLCVGLLSGVKYFALGYAAAIVVVLFCLSVKSRGLGPALGMIGTVVLTAGLTGGFWYARNWVVTGTPLYPAQFPGGDSGSVYSGDVWETTFVGNTNPSRFLLALHALWNVTGPFHVMAILLSPVVVIALFCLSVWGHHRQHQSHGRSFDSLRTLAVAGWIATFSVVWMMTPFAVEDFPGTLNQLHGSITPLRYGLTCVSIMVVGLMMIVYRYGCVPVRDQRRSVRAMGRLGLPWLVAGLIAWQGVSRVVTPYPMPLPSVRLIECSVVAVPLGVLFVVLLRLAVAFRLRSLLRVGMVAAVMSFALCVSLLSLKWHSGFASFYSHNLHSPLSMIRENPESSHGLGSPQYKRCALDHRIYPFFGSRRQFRVCRPWETPTLDSLVQYLQENDVRFVATNPGSAPPHSRYALASAFVQANPAGFTPLHRGVVWDIWEYHNQTGPSRQGVGRSEFE